MESIKVVLGMVISWSYETFGDMYSIEQTKFCKVCKCHARFKGRVKLYLSGANQNT